MSFKPTQEQQTCVTSYGKKGSFKVEAVAGSGKTSTVVLMAESDDSRTALYLCFNKAAADEADGKMPFHVTSKTTHSLAYALFGAKYREKLSRPRGGYVNVAGTVSEIVKFFKVKGISSLNKNGIARLAKLSVGVFEASASATLTEDHIPGDELAKLASKAKKKDEFFDWDGVIKVVMKVAKQIWTGRIDLKSPVLMTHDTYLKLYQLSKPKLDYDVIFLDEAQDTSDCVIDIVMGQMDHAQVVCVGDSFQAIYGWRGAVNALAKIKSQSTPLSQSFRYGPKVAAIATAILDGVIEVRGFDKMPTKIGKVDRNKPYTELFRTNAYLIDTGEQLLLENVKVRMDCDITGYTKRLESALALYNGEPRNKIKHEDICIFDDWHDLLLEAEMIEEVEEVDKVTGQIWKKHERTEGNGKGELGRIAKKVENGEAPKTLRVLRNYRKPQNPQVILTTAHKSKGMEYSQVILADDFPSVYDKEGKYIPLNELERNLAYVASTRAQECLELNRTIKDIVEHYEQEMQTLDTPMDALNDEAIEFEFRQRAGMETRSDMAMFVNEQMEDLK